MKVPDKLAVPSPKDVAESFTLGKIIIERVETPGMTIRVPANVGLFELSVVAFVCALRNYVAFNTLTFIGVKTMTDPKTTIVALLTGIVGLLSHFGILFPAWLFEPAVAIGVILLGFFAADKKTVKP